EGVALADCLPDALLRNAVLLEDAIEPVGIEMLKGASDTVVDVSGYEFWCFGHMVEWEDIRKRLTPASSALSLDAVSLLSIWISEHLKKVCCAEQLWGLVARQATSLIPPIEMSDNFPSATRRASVTWASRLGSLKEKLWLLMAAATNAHKTHLGN